MAQTSERDFFTWCIDFRFHPFFLYFPFDYSFVKLNLFFFRWFVVTRNFPYFWAILVISTKSADNFTPYFIWAYFELRKKIIIFTNANLCPMCRIICFTRIRDSAVFALFLWENRVGTISDNPSMFICVNVNSVYLLFERKNHQKNYSPFQLVSGSEIFYFPNRSTSLYFWCQNIVMCNILFLSAIRTY